MFVIRFDDDDGRIPSLEGINVKPVFDSVVVGGRKMDTGQVDSRNKVRLHGERGANNVSNCRSTCDGFVRGWCYRLFMEPKVIHVYNISNGLGEKSHKSQQKLWAGVAAGATT